MGVDPGTVALARRGGGRLVAQPSLVQQEMADRLTARTLQRAQLAQSGVHILAPGELPLAATVQTEIERGVREAGYATVETDPSGYRGPSL